jgi:PST family polysaccharide transporter
LKPFNASGAFRSSAQGDELRRLAVQGAGATVGAQGVMLAEQIISTVILARLLTPHDFGVVAMVTTFSFLFMNVGLNGITEAVVQREEIDHFLASNLVWITTGAGLLFTLGFAATGPLLARFFHNPHVAPIVVGTSLSIFLTSIGVVHLALLKRAMHFSVLAVNDIVARGLWVAASILLAWAGWGYWALVAGIVVQALSTSLGAFLLCRWVPSLPRRVPGTGAMVRFAINVFGRFSVNYGARNTDNVLVGWRFNAQALGFYKKAYDLFALSGGLLVSSVTVVAVSALSRVNRDADMYKRYLLGAIAMSAFLGMALGGDLTLIGRDVIRLVMGPAWGPAGRIFTFFGPGIGMMLLYGTHSWIHLSIGRPDRWFRWGIVEFVFTVLLFAVALPWGPNGIAVAWTVSFWILTFPALWYAGKPINFEIGPVIAAVWRYVVASVLVVWACREILRVTHFLYTVRGAAGALSRILTTSLLFTAIYVAVVVLLHQSFEPLSLVARLVPDLVGSGPLQDLSRAFTLTATTTRSGAPSLWVKLQGHYRRDINRFFSRRPFTIDSDVPLISFTFDDFPRSAMRNGGGILKRHGLAGTYYACLGLMGTQAPAGPIFLAEDLKALLEQGHELGCHTFDHFHAWQTSPAEFERSIIENRRVLSELVPGASFRTLSYPFSAPRPGIKQRAAQHFVCCRGGGQSFNAGTVDLNCLCAYFLEQGRENVEAVKNLIDQNRRARGWLIFATHDVSRAPTSLGCSCDFFERVVDWAVESGSRILTVTRALEALGVLPAGL